jgi:hypothetical protein
MNLEGINWCSAAAISDITPQDSNGSSNELTGRGSREQSPFDDFEGNDKGFGRMEIGRSLSPWG